jgi:hypothetical protein
MATAVLNPPAAETEAAAPDYGVRSRDLPDQLKQVAVAILRELQKRDLYDRRIEVLKDRLHRFYSVGIQHVYPNYGTGTYQIGTSGGYVDIGNRTIQCPDYLGDYNVVFYPMQRSLEAVLTQNPPGIDFEPDDPSVDEDIQASEVAEGYRTKFDKANSVKDIQKKLARMFCLSGRTIIEVDTVANKQKWGVNDQGEPRRMEVGNVYGALESKVPIYAKDQDDYTFCILFSDPDILRAKRDYPWIEEKITGGQGSPAESDWERWARLGVRQARKSYFLNGGSLSFITTKTKAYLRPDCYQCQCCKDVYETQPGEQPQVNEKGKPFTIKDKLEELFPDGWCITLIGENYAESVGKSLDDAIVVGFPRDGDGQACPALCEGLVVVQDSYNDKKNAERQAYEKGWPSTWVSGQAVDYDALLDQRAEPYAYHQIKELRAGQSIEDVVYREPEMELSETFVQSMEVDSGPLPQQISGALPALMGESAPGEHTASKAAMDRSQAMGMLGPTWGEMQRMFARMYQMAALSATENPDHAEEIVVPSEDGQTTKFALAKLSKGKFHCSPDTDSSFPESTAAKRTQLDSILQMIAMAPPVAIEFLSSPDNWEEVLKLKGFPELTLTPAMAYKKQTAELEILLREAPIPNPAVQQAMQAHAQASIQAEAAGMPPPPFQPPPPEISSVPIGKYDYHKWEFAKCREFLSSERCRRELAAGGPEGNGNALGVQNVELHADAHQQAMMMEAMQQAAMQPPPAPAGKPPKPPAAHAPEAATIVQNKATPPGAATV